MNSLVRNATRNMMMPMIISFIYLAVLLESVQSIEASASAHSASLDNEEAYFVFDIPPRPETFIIKITDPAKIKKARDILSGVERDMAGVGGVIIKSQACYNLSWSFYLDPNSISFFWYRNRSMFFKHSLCGEQFS